MEPKKTTPNTMAINPMIRYIANRDNTKFINIIDQSFVIFNKIPTILNIVTHKTIKIIGNTANISA